MSRLIRSSPNNMNVSLSPELQRFVRKSVESGRYKSASEVVREALRLLQEIEEERRMRQASMNAKVHDLKTELMRSVFELRNEIAHPKKRRGNQDRQVDHE